MLATRYVRRQVSMVAAAVLTCAALALPAEAVDGAQRFNAENPGTPSAELPTVSDEAAPQRAGSIAEVQGEGEWSIEPLSAGQWQVQWSAEKALPMTADRPVITNASGQSLATELSADGTTVSAVVQQAAEPKASELAVQLSGSVLDAPRGTKVAPRRAAVPAKMAAGARLLSQDPATAGSFAVAVNNYSLPRVKWKTYPQAIEMVGHQVSPVASAATGPRPLVLFLHGRHSVCYRGSEVADSRWPCRAPAKEIESQLGYDYLQRRLASQGYATVSIRVNGINAQDDRDADGGAAARAMIVRKHLDHLAATAAAQNIDLSRVILVGHSRGGEGVNRAAIQIPLSAPYRVVGQVLLAPTDFAAQSAPYVNTVTVLPSCDGDVSDLQGQQFTDVSRDLLADDTSMKSSVMVVGANHNFFNTEWTPGSSTAPSDDDMSADPKQLCGKQDPNRLSAAKQRAAGLAVVTGAVKLFASGAEQFAPLYDGSDVRVASTGDTALRSHTLGRGRSVLRVSEQFTPGKAVSGAVNICSGAALGAKGALPACTGTDISGATPHWYVSDFPSPRLKPATRFTWSKANGSVPLNLSRPLDLTGRKLAFRVAVDQRYAYGSFQVRLTDGAGRGATVMPSDGASLKRFPGALRGAHWAQAVTIDPSRATGVNLADVRTVTLVGRSATGGILVLDLETVPAAAPVVPLRRAAVVSVGTVAQVEGNGAAPVTVQVPIQVSGTLSVPARIRLVRGAKTTYQTIAAGQRSISVPVTYRPDRAWSGDRTVDLAVIPDRGVMTDTYLGGVRLEEDDPRPVLRVKPLRRSVAEGGVFKVRVSLTHPTVTPGYLSLGFKKPRSGTEMRVRDIKTKTFAYIGGPRLKLSRSLAYRDLSMKQGRTSMIVKLRTVRDSEAEGVEKARMVIDFTDDQGKTQRKSVVLTLRDH